MVSMPIQFKPGLLLIKPTWIATTANSDRDIPLCVTWWQGGSSAGYTSAQLLAIGNVFDTHMGACWAPAGPSSANYAGSYVQDYTSNTGLSVTSSPGYAGAAGTAGAFECGAQTCIVVSEKVAVRYKGGHGRLYLPYVSSNALLGTEGLQSSIQSGLNSAFAALVTAMAGISGANGGPCTPVVYRFRRDPVRASLQPVLSFSVGGTLGTQRRRLRRVARH